MEEPTSELASRIEESRGPGRGVGRREKDRRSFWKACSYSHCQVRLHQHLGTETRSFACFGAKPRGLGENPFQDSAVPFVTEHAQGDCQASDLTEMSLGKCGRNEQSLVTCGPHLLPLSSFARPSAAPCLQGKDTGEPARLCRLLVFAAMAEIHVFCCFLLCL